jgi:hypothetical protein
MSQNNEGFYIPESEEALKKLIFKNELKQAIAYIAMVVLAYSITLIVSNKLETNSLMFMLIIVALWISTIQISFTRIGNIIAGCKFYKGWLILPIVNIAMILALSTQLSSEMLEHSNNIFFKIVLSMTFIHSAFAARRSDQDGDNEIMALYNRTNVFLNKKQWWIYRIIFSSLSFVSILIMFTL